MMRSLTDLVDDLLAVQHIGTLYRRPLPVLRRLIVWAEKGSAESADD